MCSKFTLFLYLKFINIQKILSDNNSLRLSKNLATTSEVFSKLKCLCKMCKIKKLNKHYFDIS